MATITCSDSDHGSNSGYPGWTNDLGEVTGETAPNSVICPGCAAAMRDESLADAKARCIGDCRVAAVADVEASTVEHPGASGKYWSIGSKSQRIWAHLAAGKAGLSYAVVLATADGLDTHSFADAAAITACADAIAGAVAPKFVACDAALTSIAAAADIPAAELERDTYVGGL